MFAGLVFPEYNCEGGWVPRFLFSPLHLGLRGNKKTRYTKYKIYSVDRILDNAKYTNNYSRMIKMFKKWGKFCREYASTAHQLLPCTDAHHRVDDDLGSRPDGLHETTRWTRVGRRDWIAFIYRASSMISKTSVVVQKCHTEKRNRPTNADMSILAFVQDYVLKKAEDYVWKILIETETVPIYFFLEAFAAKDLFHLNSALSALNTQVQIPVLFFVPHVTQK